MHINNQQTILLVDNTPDMLAVLGDSLEFAGYKVLYAESGESAIERTLFWTPDLILLDIRMPGLDDYATCKTLKSLAALRDVPVLFMSSYWDQQALQHARAVGGTDFVRKPFQRGELLTKIASHLSLRSFNRIDFPCDANQTIA